jgi:hypothetical protein
VAFKLNHVNVHIVSLSISYTCRALSSRPSRSCCRLRHRCRCRHPPSRRYEKLNAAKTIHIVPKRVAHAHANILLQWTANAVRLSQFWNRNVHRVILCIWWSDVHADRFVYQSDEVWSLFRRRRCFWNPRCTQARIQKGGLWGSWSPPPEKHQYSVLCVYLKIKTCINCVFNFFSIRHFLAIKMLYLYTFKLHS